VASGERKNFGEHFYFRFTLKCWNNRGNILGFGGKIGGENKCFGKFLLLRREVGRRKIKGQIYSFCRLMNKVFTTSTSLGSM